MLEQDEMFRLLVTRYASKLVKQKKQASYMLQDKKQEQVQELPLEEAIAKKTDGKLMDDAYNPVAVERHWNAWWEQKYPLPYTASSSMPTTRLPIPRSSLYASLRPTLLAISTSDTHLPSPSRMLSSVTKE